MKSSAAPVKSRCQNRANTMNERAVFDAALEIRDPAQRTSFLERICSIDAELKARIEQLLSAHEGIGSFLDVPAMEQLQPNTSHPVSSTAAVCPPIADEESEHGDEDGLLRVVQSYLAPSQQPESLGKLGHYEVIQILGQGGFGIVLKAFDEKLHRNVAIKVMSPQMAATSPPRKRFLREARVAAAIRHENIVQVYSVEEQPLPYLVMEFIAGQNLQQKLDSTGPLSSLEVLHLSRQVAAGLAAAHASGLIHRDVKPGNILIEDGEERKVKITDFGLARAADDVSMTRSGLVSGTPMYMAPEQALDQPLDHRTDLFSLGSVIYQMACGRPPFRATSTVAVLRRVAEDTPRPLQEILPEIPDWLVAIVAKLHAKDPDERFQTAGEVLELLKRCQVELQQGGAVTAANFLLPLTPKRTPAVRFSSREPDERTVREQVRPFRSLQLIVLGFVCAFLSGLLFTEALGLTHFTPLVPTGSGVGTHGDSNPDGSHHREGVTPGDSPKATFDSPPVVSSTGAAGQKEQLRGMVGRGYASDRDVGMFFTYYPGYKLTREEIHELQDILTRKGRLEFVGILALSADAEVAFHHVGGSSNRGVHYLYVDDEEVHTVGDDRVKDDTLKIKLKEGKHSLRWKLTGGELGDAQLEISVVESEKSPAARLKIYASEEMVAAARNGVALKSFEFGKANP